MRRPYAEAERLLELKAGDAVSIGGRAELSVWQGRDGNHYPGLSLVADEVATAHGSVTVIQRHWSTAC